jgi:hypothetical protein
LFPISLSILFYSLPLKFREMSWFLISLHPFFTLSSSFARDFLVSYLSPSFLAPLPLFRKIFLVSYLSLSILLPLPLKFREMSLFLISLHPFYSLFLFYERLPRFLSLSTLLTLSSS